MARRGVGFLLVLASLLVLAASGNLSGIPVLLSLAAVASWMAVR